MRSTMLMTGLTLALLTGAAQAQLVGGNAGLGGSVQGAAATLGANAAVGTPSGPNAGAALDRATGTASHLRHDASAKADKLGDKAKDKTAATTEAAKGTATAAAQTAAATVGDKGAAVGEKAAEAVPPAPAPAVTADAKVEAKAETKPAPAK